jgi:polar amino acid transport system substrate-binding protein
VSNQFRTSSGYRNRRALRRCIAGASVLATLAATACSSSSSGSAGSGDKSEPGATSVVPAIANLVPKAIKSRGYLNVAAESYPTAVIVPPGGGSLSGWEPAIAKSLGKMMGIQFRFKIVDFDSIIPGLAANRYDIAMGEIAINPDRRKAVWFVTDHASTDSFMVKADGKIDIKVPTDVCGRKVAVLIGSSNLAYVQSLQPKCKAAGKPSVAIQTYKSQAEVNLALQSGRAEVDEASTGSLVPVMQQNKGVFKVLGSYNPIGTGVALAPSPNAEGLSKAISAGLNQMISDGSLQKIMDKWNQGRGVIKHSDVLPKQ